MENAYSQYLTSHSGYSNAYTASTETNYFFEISASTDPSNGPESTVDGDVGSSVNGSSQSPLYGALDRFSQFFISPLFLSETLDRELRAVDSENKKNLQSDNWRLSQLDKSLSNPRHPYHQFSTGNLQTLRDEPRKRGLDIRSEFIKFHDKYYSANRMKLVVLGKEPLDELESWVSELFAEVKNKDLPQNRWDHEQPYSTDDLLKQISAKPVMDSRTLDIMFTYQDEDHLYKSHPSRYVSHLIGHEGPGSILAYIKSKGWANRLSAGPMTVCPGSGLFNISIGLTTHGFAQYQEVVKAVFQYIAVMKQAGPQEWIVDEVKEMNQVDFRFKQKSPASKFTSRVSSTMQKPLPREWLLSGERIIREYDHDEIAKAMSYFTAENYRLTVVSQEFSSDLNKKEKWYGTDYCVEDVSEDLEHATRRALTSNRADIPSELHLPHKNEFIPSNLTVEKKEVNEPSKAPKLIRNDEAVRLWWKKDDRFWVPKGTIMIILRSPSAAVTPENSVKANLYCMLVKDALNEYSYDAEIAGLEYDLTDIPRGLHVQISGYNEKMPVLLEKVLTCMRDINITPERFQIVKERLLRGYRNWDYQQPFHQVGDFTRWLNNPKGWINEHYLAELPHISVEDVASFYPQLLKQIHMEVLVHGNLYKEDALRMTKLLETTLKPRPLPRTLWQARRNLLLPLGSDFTYRRNLGDPANVNNCIEYYLYVGEASEKRLRAQILLLDQLGDELGFDQLRTKEQLGYIVFTGARAFATTGGYRVVIQSERSPEYLEERINAFLMTFHEKLEEMSQSEFEGHKRSIINKRLEKLKNLNQEGNRFYSHISNEYYHFVQADTDVAELKPLTKADMIGFFNYYIHPESPHRTKLSVHLSAQPSPKQVAPELDPKEQKDKVVGLLTKSLNATGIDADGEKLAEKLANVDVSGGDQTAILEAVSKYLLEDARVSNDKANQVLEQGAQLMGAILPALGIEVKQAGDNDLRKAPKVKQTTFIENVPEWKATLQASSCPRPVVDLTEFEDFDPKL